MDDESSLSDQLRQIADLLDLKQADPIGPDCNIANACKRLSTVIKRGKLVIEIGWENWGEESYAVEYEVKREYSSIAEGKNLAEVINKAIVKHQPTDTLDKLSKMMPETSLVSESESS